VADLIDLELFPSMRCAALTLTADLKPEQTLDVASDPVVVRLDDSGASGFVDELDEMLAADCVHEFVVHSFTAERRLHATSLRPTARRASGDHHRVSWPASAGQSAYKRIGYASDAATSRNGHRNDRYGRFLPRT
jgi:hypothetical protein